MNRGGSEPRGMALHEGKLDDYTELNPSKGF